TAGNVYPAERLIEGARAFARETVLFDALALAREHDTEANAILLGALAGSGALPIPDDAYRAAIEHKGVAVKANLRGFDLGRERASAAPTNGSVANGGRPDTLESVIATATERLVEYQDRAY